MSCGITKKEKALLERVEDDRCWLLIAVFLFTKGEASFLCSQATSRFLAVAILRVPWQSLVTDTGKQDWDRADWDREIRRIRFPCISSKTHGYWVALLCII